MVNEEYSELLKVGLTDGEAKVYLALSEIGSSTVGPIVKLSGVAYSNVYDILNRLIKKGLVSFVIKEKTKHFSATSPINLLEYLNKKQSEILENKESLKKIIPQLERLREKKNIQEAEVFVGLKGLRSAYEKLFQSLTKKDEALFFYLHDDEYAEESDQFYHSMWEITRKFNIKGIANKKYENSWFAKKAKKMKSNLKFVKYPIPGNIDIIKDMVFIVSWRPSVVGILIKSESIANNLRNYFNEVWKSVK
ncbi:MAG: helix-turn-helix domain-containing protein [Nanoarchaeota archaeon]